MLIVDRTLNDEHQPDLHKADVIRIPIEPHFAGDYRLEYDGKYITLFGRDRNYVGFKFNEDDEDWYEEMVLIPVVVERRNICPEIISVDEQWISVRMGCV
jgi:hypothetical protein